MIIILRDLPKVSLNQWYSGKHWSKRKQLKDTYKLLIKSEFKSVFSHDYKYTVDYHFEFKRNPLDASNCVAMVKMIEDCLFEDDKYDIIKGITITSNKGKSDKVTIIVNDFID